MRRKRWLVGALALGLMVGGPGMGTAQDQQTSKKLNPYTGDPEVATEGRRVYFLYSCNACHGGTGGGGMAGVAGVLTDDTWQFGSDDETLFKLLKGEIPNQTMPPLGQAMTAEEIWKVIAWIRTLYTGDPSKIDW